MRKRIRRRFPVVGLVLVMSCLIVGAAAGPAPAAGQAWTPPYYLDQGPLDGLSCVGFGFCAATDLSGNGFILQGDEWTEYKDIDPHPLGWMWAISCASTAFCMTVDHYGSAIEYKDGTWLHPHKIDPGGGGVGGGLDSIACPTVHMCLAVDHWGNAIQYHNGRWSDPVSVDPVQGVYSGFSNLACSNRSFCVATDDSGYVFTFDGQNWSAPLLVDPRGFGRSGMDCFQGPECVLGDPYGRVFTYIDGAWSGAVDITGDYEDHISAVSCRSASSCMALDGGNEWIRFGHGLWHRPESLPGPFTNPTAVACRANKSCIAFTYRGMTSTFQSPEGVGA